MTIYTWSLLADQDELEFVPGTDVLEFDGAESAADVVIGIGVAETTFSHGGKTVTLQAAPETLGDSSVTFADGSSLDFGTGAAETLAGGSGADQLAGLAGNDSLAGEAGEDLATFSGLSSGHAFSASGSNVVVTDTDTSDGGDGTDTLSGIEAARFGDELIAIGPLGEFQVNTTTANSQSDPVVAGLTGGGFVVVWTSDDGSGLGVYAQLLDAGGSKVGEEFRVSTDTASDQSTPAVTALSGGGFAVTWAGQDASGTGIFVQRYDADGTALGTNTQVNTTTLGDQSAPVIADRGSDQFAVAWISGSTVFVRRFNDAGQAESAEVSVGTHSSSGALPGIALAGFGDGTYSVIWQNGSQIYGKTYLDNGQSPNGEFQIGSGTDGVIGSVVEDSDESVYAVASGSNLTILHMDVVEPRGPFARTSFGETTTEPVVVTSLGINYGFVAVWESQADGDGSGIYAQRFDDSLASVGEAFKINTHTSDDQGSPAVAALADGGFVVVWASDLQDGSGSGIYAARFDAEGNPADRQLSGDDGDNFLAWSGAEEVALAGGDGNDTLQGGTGNDRLDGGEGIDVASYANATGGINANHAAVGGAGDDALVSIERVIGSSFGDELYAGIAGIHMEGGEGGDTLGGSQLGATLAGGNGDDFYDLGIYPFEEGEAPGDVLVELSGGGVDTLRASEKWTLPEHFEVLVLHDAQDLALEGTGNAAANLLVGNGFDNTLDGGGGNDTLSGGGGGDAFEFAAGEGIDLVTDYDLGDRLVIAGLGEAATFAAGNGSGVLQDEIDVSSSGGITTLHVGLDSIAGAELQIRLTGEFPAAQFELAENGIVLVELPGVTQAGMPDASFGDDGVVATAVGPGMDVARGVAIDGEDRILVAGSASNGANDDFALVRYAAGGGLDATFSGDGKLTTSFGSGADEARAVALQSDGKIVVVGTAFTGAGMDVAVARYNADGSLDTTFSGDGKATIAIAGDDAANAVAVTAEGKIVVAGSGGSSEGGHLLVARFDADGTLDTGYNGVGWEILPVGEYSAGTGVAVQADGKILVGGYSYLLGMEQLTVGRVGASGGTDLSFGSSGGNFTSFGGSFGSESRGNALAVQADGKILVAGSFSQDGGVNHQVAVARFTANGFFDSAFDGDGRVLLDSGIAYGIALHDDGRIVLGGADGGDFLLVQLDAGGSGDTTHVPVIEGFDAAYGAGLQSSGRIVLAGEADGDIAVVRLLSEDGDIPDQAAWEDQAFTFTVGAETFFDPHGDPLEYGATLANGAALPAWLGFDVETRTFSGTPANDDVGQIDVRVIATDPGGLAGSDVFTLTVGNVNDWPTVDEGIPDQAATEDEEFQFVVPADAFEDVDGDELGYFASLLVDDQLEDLPDWLEFDAGTRTFAGTPGNGDVGSLEIRVRVTDPGNGFASADFTLTVANVNDAPTREAQIGDDTIQINNPFELAVPAENFDDVDAGDSLGYSATLGDGSALPSWLAFDPETRTFGGTPLAAHIGTLQVKVVATDESGATATDTFALEIVSDEDYIDTGTSGPDTLDGGTGADTMVGRGDGDTYFVDNAGDAIVELPEDTGTDRVFASASYTLPAEVENLLLTGSGDIDGTGNGLSNRIIGNDGDNVLDGAGGLGGDILEGGNGDDSYVVDDDDDDVVELDGGGSDTVVASVDHTLAANVEGLLVAAGEGLEASGNGLANAMTGGEGADTLLGLGGADTLAGGNGNDSLDGGAGADSVAGGAGDDTVRVDHSGDAVTEQSNQGADLVLASVSWTLGANLEHLILTGSATNGRGNSRSNQIIGNSGDNLLEGMAGGDLLKGEAGADTMAGGSGNDLYYVDDAGDVVKELANGGSGDRVYTTIAIRLPNYVESVTVVDPNLLFIVGNGLNNFFEGSDGDDSLVGGGGNDTMDGLGGEDTLDGGAGIDSMVGGSGNDLFVVNEAGDVVVELANGPEELGQGAEGAGLAGFVDTVKALVDYSLAGRANIENLALAGKALKGTGNNLDNDLVGNVLGNTLIGQGGADRLWGRQGNDTLTGGTGADWFVFDVAPNAAKNLDLVKDFVSGADRIVLDDDVFAALGSTGTLAATKFRLGAAAGDASDRVIYDDSTGALYYDPDGTGLAAQVRFATLTGAPTLTAADILVIG